MSEHAHLVSVGKAEHAHLRGGVVAPAPNLKSATRKLRRSGGALRASRFGAKGKPHYTPRWHWRKVSL